jgi:hypothetical protein
MMESNSYSASESSASSKIAESNRESAYIVDPLQHDHTNLAKVLGHTDNAMSKASADARLDSLKGHKSQNSQPPKEVVAEGLWANTAIDPHDLLQSFAIFDTDAGAISDRNVFNVYRSMTPTDTPELSTSGSSEPNSYVSEGVEFSINVDGKLPALNSSSLDDVGDTSAFDKPFAFDTSIYSMASPPAQDFFLEGFNLEELNLSTTLYSDGLYLKLTLFILRVCRSIKSRRMML